MEIPTEQVFIKNSFECMILDMTDENKSERKAWKASPDEFFGRTKSAVFADSKKPVQNREEIEKENEEYKKRLDIQESARSDKSTSEQVTDRRKKKCRKRA